MSDVAGTMPSAARPATSIVVPVWGAYGGAPLTEALDSLRAQDVAARIIVVDNASEQPLRDPDGADVIRSEARLTVGAARNLGLEHVTTPYVLFWDADDLMLPGTLRHLEQRLSGEPEAVLVAAAIQEDDPRVPHRWPRRWSYRFPRAQTPFALAHCVWSLFPTTGSTLMRTGAVRDAGGYGDANSGEDWVLGVSLAFRGRVVLDPRPGRIYRRHPGSLWESGRSREHLLRHAGAVRDRVRSDPGVPVAVKRLTPAIAALQLLAIDALQPAARAVRALSRRSSGRSAASA